MNKEQKIIISTNSAEKINAIVKEHGIKKLLLVCDSSFGFLEPHEEYEKISVPYVIFNEFTSNPLYADVCKGVELFRQEKCDAILAIGGGSAIDVAKCIKLFCKMPDSESYLTQEYKENNVLLIGVPTTSGTGSESTRYAVVYFKGQKQSVTHESIVPSYALLDRRNLNTLPVYQKKCTMLDALCQGIESWWSINANEESRVYSKKAIELIMENKENYLENTDQGNEAMMLAANYAGRAINITQTTAAHAMSYKLTSLYKVPHGRAAFMCLPRVWNYMLCHTDQSQYYAQEELEKIFNDIAAVLKCSNAKQAVVYLEELEQELFEKDSVNFNVTDAELLSKSVNVTRLKNNPVKLNEDTLHHLYIEIIQRTAK